MDSALISSCGQYRYSLARELESPDTDTVLFVMLNPSTADGSNDDPTINRLRGFASSWGYGRFTVGNLYAYRTPSPKALWDARAAGFNIVGPDNMRVLHGLACDAHEIVVAWGSHATRDPGHAMRVLEELRDTAGEVCCLTETKDGWPGHPLYLPKNLRPVPYGKF